MWSRLDGGGRIGAMRRLRLLETFAAIALLTAASLEAQDAQAEFVRQSEILEQDLDQYIAARERQTAAVDELRSLNTQLNRLFGDMSAPVSEMRRLESQVAASLDRAYQSLRETARARGLIYDQMDRLAVLATQIEERPPDPIDADNPQGFWEFRLEPIGISALVELKFQGGGVNNYVVMVGSYRSSNGNRGTLRGTFANGRMELEVMDRQQGRVATMNGQIGFQGRVEGTWAAVQSGLNPSDRASAGTFTARRVHDESDVSFD
jgi:hypothetical protein